MRAVAEAILPIHHTPTDPRLMQAAQELEASFLAEMLKHSGLGKLPESMGGSEGEEHFQSLFLQEQAMVMVRAGGIGLAENIYQSLKERTDERP
ncbi:rod-binding protein [Pelagimonas sp. KU-00592-HH]|uniref:rod-binding protein n=1 Tax=Pelagimonas sp. KU-00592-HH TaxID=3127651 RepID=UPI00310A8040